ncbi:hypothetical protein BS47DRAFT_1365934 [Hydnum rufescens UP504]|uniref:Uncharacterized protein n=1 Tax=Hydnum rufescens UP504 TaxID=1448309 RepID=A0A9P6AN27_9AGAM|nr:hypothetical protein BS47DRAFT_1365934 [Hydnum rufescens UP504]
MPGTSNYLLHIYILAINITWALSKYRQLLALNCTTTQPHPATAQKGEDTTTHPRLRVCGHKTKARMMRADTATAKPKQTTDPPMGGPRNHTPAAVIDQTQQNNDLPNEPPPPRIHDATRQRRPTGQSPRQNHTPASAGVWVSSKMTTRQNNIRQTKPANDNWPDRTPDETTPAKAVCYLNPQQTPPPNKSYKRDPPKPPSNETQDRTPTTRDHRNCKRNHTCQSGCVEMDHTPAVAGYHLNHLQNESPKPNAPRNTPRRNPGTRTHNTRPQGPQTNHTCFGGCVIILRSSTVKPNDNPLNKPPRGMMMRPAMTPAKRTTPTMTGQTKPKRAPHTRFCGCVVILSLSSGPNTCDPAE